LITLQTEYYNASVSEDAAVGTPVLTVSATDLDLDRNGNVTYLLEMTSADVGHFVIDKVTGVISVARYVVMILDKDIMLTFHLSHCLHIYTCVSCPRTN